mgnify:CR=1 FL=1
MPQAKVKESEGEHFSTVNNFIPREHKKQVLPTTSHWLTAPWGLGRWSWELLGGWHGSGGNLKLGVQKKERKN